jgi:hypothetical protein
MEDKHTILGIHITDRLEEAVEVQKVLTEHGQYIKTRLGLHDVGTGAPGLNGLLLCEMAAGDDVIQAMADKLNAMKGVEVQSLVFYHP